MLSDWHVEPDDPRTFDIELAKSKLDAAGYKLDANGARLDKEGKPIKLRLYAPDSEAVVREVRGVRQGLVRPARASTSRPRSSRAPRSATLVLPPEADGTAKYDIELWGWAGNPDPNALL